MIGEEDLFNLTDKKVSTLVIRYGDSAKQKFDASNKMVPLNQIIETLSNGEWDSYITKRTDQEFQISIPVENLGGQFDLVVEYNQVKFTYEMKVQFTQKTRFRLFESLPSSDYSFQQKVKLVFIDLNAPWTDLGTLQDMQELKNKALSLPISPAMSIELQQDIWDQYIEAQSQLVDRLLEPYSCIGEPELTKEQARNGDGIFRYRLDFRLHAENQGEYDALQQSLRDDLGIDAEFDSDGVAYMRFDDISRGLDTVIRRNFKDRYERNPKIGCIIPIRPFSVAEKLGETIGDSAALEQRGIYIHATPKHNSITELLAKMKAAGYEPIGVRTRYDIAGVDNLFQSEHVDKYSLTFSSDGKFQKKNGEREMLLPEPFNKEDTNEHYFVIEKGWREDYDLDQLFMLKSLKYVYGKDNVVQSFSIKFRPIEWIAPSENEGGFTNDEWNDINKDLFALEWYDKSCASDTDYGKTIFFDFETEEEMKQKFSDLQSISKYVIVKSPLDPDFGFKVTTNILTRKTQQQKFRENLDKLNGAEFVYDYQPPVEEGEKPKKVQPVYIGKLNSYESSSDHLVLYIPNKYKEEQEAANKTLDFIAKHPRIPSIHANLAGDRAKIDWLKEAMHKLRTTGSWEPNASVVNDKIKEFIFDSSKAEPIFKYLYSDIRETPEYKDFDKTAILTLNQSQKEAVLKGVASRDLCMLQGPPGTGKTTVIAELIWQHIRENQNSKLLLTSETNLAVDNALEKLMNGKAANPEMARYLTLIKPLRFGRASKFEEEGKRYSIERIEKWVDGANFQDGYDDEQLSEENIELDEPESGMIEDNVLQNWMRAIAFRSESDPRYREVLKDWQIGLAQPDTETRILFRDLYFKHVNVVGSTCSSTGSPAFMAEYLKIFRGLSDENMKNVRKHLYCLKNSDDDDNKEKVVNMLANDLDISANTYLERRSAVSSACGVTFDTVIMDEASKATPPELLMPLCFGTKSIVIGDHRQLPPMLNERSFREALLDLETEKAQSLADEIDRSFVDTSQFKRMILNPQVSSTIKATFNTQYRMHPHINNVISQFYENDECGGLCCGLDMKRVDSPDLSDPQSRYHGFYSEGFITPDVHTIWVNVDAPESTDGSSKINLTEIEAINKVIAKLKKSSGFDSYMKHWDSLDSDVKRNEEKEIGVISFYGKQVRKIRESVLPFARRNGIRIKMNTVDKFQGMERNIVIVSTVRSDKSDTGNGRIVSNKESGFAKSPERLNVALSRARRLLIVVGNKDFYCKIKDKDGNYLYRNAIMEIERSGRVIDFKDLRNE